MLALCFPSGSDEAAESFYFTICQLEQIHHDMGGGASAQERPQSHSSLARHTLTLFFLPTRLLGKQLLKILLVTEITP